MKLVQDSNLRTVLKELKEKNRAAAKQALRESLSFAEGAARWHALWGTAGWQYDTGNLARTITGYVAGDNLAEVYRYEGNVIVPGARERTFTARKIDKNGSVRYEQVTIRNTGSYLAKHYKVNRKVSPPITAPKDGTILGVLHKYMQYAGNVQDMVGGNSVLVNALREPEAQALLRAVWEREMFK